MAVCVVVVVVVGVCVCEHVGLFVSQSVCKCVCVCERGEGECVCVRVCVCAGFTHKPPLLLQVLALQGIVIVLKLPQPLHTAADLSEGGRVRERERGG